MELKRYVLLDNNMVVDRTKLDEMSAYGHLMLGILKRIELNDTENLCRQLVSTSDNVSDLIRKLDLILINTGRVILIRSEEQVRYWKAQCHRLIAIYKLQCKDYICVWEREVK